MFGSGRVHVTQDCPHRSRTVNFRHQALGSTVTVVMIEWARRSPGAEDPFDDGRVVNRVLGWDPHRCVCPDGGCEGVPWTA